MAHSHGHGHGHGGAADLVPATRAVRLILAVVVGGLGTLTIVAVATLWPRDAPRKPAQTSTAVTYLDATVMAVAQGTCGPVMQCEAVQVRLDAGTLAGTTVALNSLPPSTSTPLVQVGDRIVVSQEISLLAEAPAYNFVDFQRRVPLWFLAGLFALVVIGVAGWRGAASLVGLGLTWAVLMQFVLPAILAGSSPIAVSLAGSALIMFAVLYLSHGFNARTTTALIGTLVSLTCTGLLAWVFVEAAHLTGLASDEASFLANSGPAVNLSGLLLSGVIIGSLGVLNDVTVTQASAVWEVHAADPQQTPRRLYRSGMRIGRDHIASTVYTLVLAYAGAALPLLVLFVIGDQRLGDILTGELVAEELVRTLVGSIGLVASVPLTTLLAAVIVTNQQPVEEIEEGEVLEARSDAVGVGAGLRRVVAGSTAVLTTAPARARTRAAERRERRLVEKAERAAAKQAAWEAPAAEREFWGDDQ